MGSVMSTISSTIARYPLISMGVLLVLVIGIVYFIFFSSSKKQASDPEDTGNALNGKKKGCDASMCSKAHCKNIPGCLSLRTPPSDELFLNMQPPTIAHAGLDEEGSFDKDGPVIAALTAGIRSFTLQIDMLDIAKSDKFDEPGVPTLLYRGTDGSLISENSGKISDVATAIVNAGFKETVPSYDEPIVLYLHIVRAPNQVTEAAKYKTYLGQIATALQPLAPRHLGSTETGIYHRQLQEDAIMTMPLRNLSGKVIILCNADTSVFKGATSTVSPADDLDYWVNMRVYALNSSDTNVGIAQKYTGEGEPNAVIASLKSLVDFSERDALAFALKSKTRYVIAMPTENPDSDDLDMALKTLGVNIVPIDFFLETTADAADYMESYDNMAWPEKIASLRSN
jgi:hypothetical protein